MAVVDIERVAGIVREVAQAEIMPRFRGLKSHQIHEKTPGNLVTEADVEAEKALARRLAEVLPGAAVVGEEGVHHDPRLLEALERPGDVWVLDPVDGTANFAHNRPSFGVIVALVRDGRTVAGWIHDPVHDVMATVEEGGGAWIGNERLHVAADGDIAGMSGSLGYRRNKRVTGAVRALWRQGSVAQDYIALAQGRLHFAYYRKLMPWDHAAGVLMHREAGGYGALLDGRPYRPVPDKPGLLLTPGPRSWQALAPLVQEGP